MHILIVGLGSIGTRHLKNIISLGYKKISVVTRSGKLLPEYSHIPAYTTIESALESSSFDTAIVCTPTSQHFSDLQKLITSRIKNFYIEKPLSHNLDGLENLQKKLQKQKCRVFVGYDMRFDLGLQKVKELIRNNQIGKIISINAMVGQYLPDWRPDQDYKNSVSAKLKLGGGVMLDLIHEFDYVQWLVGNVKTIAALYLNSGSLDIETEDVAKVILTFSNGAIGTIHLDYLQKKIIRHCIITGSEGTITWDMTKNEVNWNNPQKETFVYSYEIERNERFMHIMEAFLQEKDNFGLVSLEEGLISLRMVLAAKYSSEHQVFVQFESINSRKRSTRRTN